MEVDNAPIAAVKSGAVVGMGDGEEALLEQFNFTEER